MLSCPSYFREEDLVELCVGICQEHPEYVPKLSDSDVVQRFKHESKMMATTCYLNVATIWQGEPIILHNLPPKGRQIKEYTAVSVVTCLVPRYISRVWGAGAQPLPMCSVQKKYHWRPWCPCPGWN